jgi:glutathione S-transferase
MTQKLTFYTNPMSRGRIVRWMLEELGVQYETKVLEYDTTMKGAEYLAVNPMGKVPAIKHGETIVTECPAICAYLAEEFPEAKLAPTAKERGAYYRWLFFAAGPLEQAVFFNMFGVEISKDKEKSLGFGNLQATLDALSAAVSSNTYIAGERFTAADVYVGSHIGWSMQFGSLEKRPEFISYWERISNRAAKLKANEMDNALIAK